VTVYVTKIARKALKEAEPDVAEMAEEGSPEPSA